MMLKLLLIPVLGLAPGIFWLWLIYKGDKYRPEPKSLVIRTFLLGIAIVLPVALIEGILQLPLIRFDIQHLLNINLEQLSIGDIAYLSFIVAGFTEELFKFLVVRTTVYKSPYFDEHIDGLIYSSAVALGFASLENVLYLFSSGWQVILIRAPISTVAHVVFSVMWGYPLALRKLKKRNATLFVWLGLLGSIVGHGLFDFLALVIQSADDILKIPLLIGLIALFSGMVVFFVLLLMRAQKVSPFKGINAELLVLCQNCQAHIPYYAKFCPTCGNKLLATRLTGPVFCGRCGTELDHKTSYCTSCGSRIIKKAKIVDEYPQ